MDSPGHAAPIWLSHPEHIACHHATPWERYAASPPAGQFRITSAATQEFARKIYGALARQVRSAFLGTGGDEVNLACYGAGDKKRDATGQVDIQRALEAFVNGTHSALREAGKTPVVWQGACLYQFSHFF
jgi:hexosaminidase